MFRKVRYLLLLHQIMCQLARTICISTLINCLYFISIHTLWKTIIGPYQKKLAILFCLELLLLVALVSNVFPYALSLEDYKSLDFILYALSKNCFLAGKMVSFKI